MIVNPYLIFNGRCDEAVAFYQKAIGAKVEMTMRFKDMPDPPPGMITPETENRVMHMQFQVGESTIMASDGMGVGDPKFESFSLSISLTDVAAAERMFKALADGGQVEMPLGKTFWSQSFGMLKDRFGVGWMINVAL